MMTMVMVMVMMMMMIVVEGLKKEVVVVIGFPLLIRLLNQQ